MVVGDWKHTHIVVEILVLFVVCQLIVPYSYAMLVHDDSTIGYPRPI